MSSSTAARSGSSIRINPLSVAKGQSHTCELCSLPSTLLCSSCRVTYYCSTSHQSIDERGIHHKICSLLGALRSLRPTLGSEEERQRRQLTIAMSQHAIIDLCKNEAKKLIVKEQFTLAIPGALQALRFSTQLYGTGRVELVPAYLLLAEANLGLNNLQVAEEFLLYANWAILHSPPTPPAPVPSSSPSSSSSSSPSAVTPVTSLLTLKSNLQYMFGLLYFKSLRFDKSLDSFAQSIYHLSLEQGPEHIQLTPSLYQLALVFQSRGEMENCLSLIDKILDIYSKFLLNIKYRVTESINDYLSDLSIAQYTAIITSLLYLRVKYLGHSHLAVGEAANVLGLIKEITASLPDALYCYELASNLYAQHLGATNESSVTVQRMYEEVKARMTALGLGSSNDSRGGDGGEGVSIDISKIPYIGYMIVTRPPEEEEAKKETQQQEEQSTGRREESKREKESKKGSRRSSRSTTHPLAPSTGSRSGRKSANEGEKDEGLGDVSARESRRKELAEEKERGEEEAGSVGRREAEDASAVLDLSAATAAAIHVEREANKSQQNETEKSVSKQSEKDSPHEEQERSEARAALEMSNQDFGVEEVGGGGGKEDSSSSSVGGEEKEQERSQISQSTAENLSVNQIGVEDGSS